MGRAPGRCEGRGRRRRRTLPRGRLVRARRRSPVARWPRPPDRYALISPKGSWRGHAGSSTFKVGASQPLDRPPGGREGAAAACGGTRIEGQVGEKRAAGLGLLGRRVRLPPMHDDRWIVFVTDKTAESILRVTDPVARFFLGVVCVRRVLCFFSFVLCHDFSTHKPINQSISSSRPPTLT